MLDGRGNSVTSGVEEDDLDCSVSKSARVLDWNSRTQTPLATRKPAIVNANPATRVQIATNENAPRTNTERIVRSNAHV